MKLPNPDRAIIDAAKLSDYCLSTTHPFGKAKARVFLSTLGITAADAPLLHLWLFRAVANHEAVAGETDHFGTRYIIDFPASHLGRNATIRSAWIVRQGEDFPRLVTCYVL